MSELLIELFCEEIPAMMQARAETAYLDIFKKYFQEKEIVFEEIKIFTGPRRIAIFVNGVAKEIKGKFISIKGPRTDSLPVAIEGFCKSNDISKADLIVREVKGVECYFYEKEIASQPTKLALLDSLTHPILEYVWPKSMYWSDYKIKWVRPLKNILCVFDGEVIPFKLGHLTANNITFGHRFMSPKQISVKDFAGYKKDLEENFVILDREERKAIISNDIREKIEILSKKYKTNYLAKDDPALLEEVAGLAEYPVVLCGRIEDRFLELPSEVLVSSMRTHQKYFSLFGQTKFSEKGEVFDTTKKEFFAPFFLFVSNIKSPDDNIIIKGNEKVLSARLSDSLYFYQQDLKKPLLDSLNKLDKVIFHAKLGSMKQKTARLAQLTKYITSHFQQKEAEDAALLCKSDLVSEMVGEFPELQGIMGYYYAIAEGRDKKIAIAIRDHYKPRGSSDSIPGDPNLGGDASAVLALADKIDSLCGLMLAGEKPTSSKDPYGLRRLALGIIRIILENRLEQDLKKLIEHSCDLYPKGVNSNSEDADQIISFIEDRVKNYFKEEFDLARVNAVVNCRLEPSLCSVKWKLEALNSFLDTEKGRTSLNSYKRASNILGSAELNGEINTNLLHREEEKKLLEFLKLATPKIDSLIEEKMFSESLKELAKVNNLIGNFFDNVMVMDSDAKIANNRLLLLARTKQLFNKVANFDQL